MGTLGGVLVFMNDHTEAACKDQTLLLILLLKSASEFDYSPFSPKHIKSLKTLEDWETILSYQFHSVA